jgi:hypothetical protein
VSTLRDTAAAAIRLQKALAQINAVEEFPLVGGGGAGDNLSASMTFANNKEDDSIIQPSVSTDRLSVEEMQRSLSREGSPNTTACGGGPDVSFATAAEEVGLTFMNQAAERSISFAPTTQQVIFQEVVAAVSEDCASARFTVVEGRTKEQDGTAGMARRILLNGQNLDDRDVNSQQRKTSEQEEQRSLLGNDSVVSDYVWDESSICVNLDVSGVSNGYQENEDDGDGGSLARQEGEHSWWGAAGNGFHQENPAADMKASTCAANKSNTSTACLAQDSIWEESIVEATAEAYSVAVPLEHLELVHTWTPANILNR